MRRTSPGNRSLVVLEVASMLYSWVVSLDTVFARFSVGQIVRHKLFNYRGVVVDVDPRFAGSEEWYEKMAPSRPPKNKPWYKVLMHSTDNHTYVAERNLEPDESGDPIAHPDLDAYFIGLGESGYVSRARGN